MHIKYSSGSFLILSFMAILFVRCNGYNDHEPLEIIDGEIDLIEGYNKSSVKNGTIVEGKITNKATNKAVEDAIITVRRKNSAITFSTTSKSDGTFELVVEGGFYYAIYAEKNNFYKTYYSNPSTNLTDTLFMVSNYNFGRQSNCNISLEEHDPNVFKVNYQDTKYTNYGIDDLGFNGAYLTTIYAYSPLAYQFDSEGNYKKSSPFIESMNFIACQDAVYWSGTSSSKTLHKVDQNTGNILSSISCQTATAGYTDVEIFGNSIWLITSSQLYMVSLTGNLLNTVDLSQVIPKINLVGICYKSNYLYLLNKEYEGNSMGSKGYTLYKVDAVIGKVLTKGDMPRRVEDINLKGLAYDGKSFWTIGISTANEALVRLSITE